ncbi:MAG: FAD-dependent oxidoreductase [Victivallaceae bacterium]
MSNLNQISNTEYDVVVCGLGTAGAIALIETARRGLKVLGVERTNFMGGIGTGGLVAGYYIGLNGGLHDDLDSESKELAKGSNYLNNYHNFNAEMKKIVLEQQADKAGADYLYQALVVKLILDHKQITGAEIFVDGVITEVRCHYFIDATADGNCARSAGIPFNYGRQNDNLTHSYNFDFASVGSDRVIGFTWFDAGLTDQTNPEQLAQSICKDLRFYFADKFEAEGHIAYFAPLLGLREGPLLIGKETVQAQDILNEQYTAEPVFYEYSNFDSHNTDWVLEDDALQELFLGGGLWSHRFYVPLPRGVMLPKDYENILVIGRAMAINHALACAVRMKQAMQYSGQTAAIMIDLALKQHCSIMDLPYEAIKQEIIRGKIPLERYELQNAASFLMQPEEIIAKLNSETPALGIWSVKRMGSAITEQLHQFCHPANTSLAINSALALGLAGDSFALPTLRYIAFELKDSTPIKHERAAFRYSSKQVSAIYFLGKLGEESDIDRLIEFIDGLNYPEVDFELLAIAVKSLVKLAEKYPANGKKIKAIIIANVKRAAGHLKYPVYGKVFEVDRQISFDAIINKL